MISNINGFILYKGKSVLDGKPIIVISTMMSWNIKTGNIIQTWILRPDMSPIQAVSVGADISVCGNCNLRGVVEKKNGVWKNRGRGCYVVLYHAPSRVYSAYKRGNYPKFSKEYDVFFKGESLRLGSYGDPVAVPLKTWEPILSLCQPNIVGYTRYWREKRFQEFRSFLMASTQSIDEVSEAEALGWRSYRIRRGEDSPILPGEIICPASKEAGYRTNCKFCMKCNGVPDPTQMRKSIVTVAHGAPKRIPSVLAHIV